MEACRFAAEAAPLVLKAAQRLMRGFSESVLFRTPFDEREAHWEEEADSLGAVLARHHPQAMVRISTPGMAWTPDPVNVLRFATLEAMHRALRSREWRLEPSVQSVVQELDSFLHSTSVETLVVAEVVGLQLPKGHDTELVLGEDPHVSLMPLTDDLVSDFNLGPSLLTGSNSRLVGSCAIVARAKQPVWFGEPSGSELTPDADRFASVQDLLVALQVTHPTPIGTPRTSSRPTTFTLCIGLNSYGYSDSPRLGVMNLDLSSIDRCRTIYRGLRSGPHPSMRLACSRLGLSRMRLRPEDAILDAAIGLEGVLLWSPSAQKQELRYRFSLHYALLDSRPETRKDRFQRAKHAYDIRSSIAHGGHPDPRDLRKLDSVATLEAGSKVMQGMLEECITAFHSDMKSPVFTRGGYWDNLALGLT
jgi:hypothetical protein